MEVKLEPDQDTDFVTTLLRLMGARLARVLTVLRIQKICELLVAASVLTAQVRLLRQINCPI